MVFGQNLHDDKGQHMEQKLYFGSQTQGEFK
jgi:hypothetical protein